MTSHPLTIELWMLLASAVLMLAMPPVYGQGYIKQLGVAKMVGNRENMPPVEGWFARGKRAHANLGENLIPFTALVLIAAVAGIHTGVTETGAILFFLARLAHAASYLAGIGPARTLSYVVGLAGCLLIAFAIAFT